MNSLTLKCNNCGATLEINEQIKFFNCTSCNTSLALKKSGNVAYTEVSGHGNSVAKPVLETIDINSIENEIARLDREWMIEKKKYQINTKYGSKTPNKHTSAFTIIGTVLGLGFMIFWISTVMSANNSGDGTSFVFVLFGIVGVIFLIVNSFTNVSKSENYMEAESQYQQKRNDLLQQLNKMK